MLLPQVRVPELLVRMISLFSGIGGFEAAARYVWPDIEIVAMCEKEPFCRQVLEKHFPGVPIVEDVNDVEAIIAYANQLLGNPTRQELERRRAMVETNSGKPECRSNHRAPGTVDLVTAGVPCQPASHAGKRQGASDARWLWPQTLAVVEATHPRWCVFENPTGFLTLNGGLEFESVCARLEREGYWVEAFVIPACAAGAPHRRDRVWIVANSDAERCGRRENDEGQESATGNWTQVTNRDAQDSHVKRSSSSREAHTFKQSRSNSIGASNSNASHAQSIEHRPRRTEPERQQWRIGIDGTDCTITHAKSERPGETREYLGRSEEWIAGSNRDAPNATQQLFDRTGESRPARRNEFADGGICRNPWREHWYAAAARLCRVAHGTSRGVDGHRTDRLRALGNAIVPQVAIRIFEAIKQADLRITKPEK